MKSQELSNGPQQQLQQQQPTQTEIDAWANQQAWRLIVRGIGLVAIFNLSRGIANVFNRSMGGSPSQLSGRDD